MKKINIGIIGVGGAGRAHAKRYKKNKFVDEVRGYDIKEIDFDAINMRYDFNTFLDGLDAVSICTPDDTHYEYIVKCLEARKHVLVEKPMVASLDEAIKLKKTLSKYPDLKFGVHHQMRFVPAFQQAKKILNKNELGKVFYIEANYWHDMRERNTKFDNWRVKGKGQSVIFGGACHPLDLLMHLNGGDISEHQTLYSKNGYEDYPSSYTSATTILKFKDGVVAKCHTNNSVVFPQFNNLIVLGDKGTYIDGILYKNGLFSPASYGNPRVKFKNFFSIGFIEDMLVRLLTKSRFFRQNPQTVYDHNGACEIIINDFVDSVANNKSPLVGYGDGFRVIELCEQIESTESTGSISLNSGQVK